MSKIQNVKLKVVGVTFTNDDTGTPRQSILAQLNTESAVFLDREPNNKYDKNAVKVMTLLGQVGYIGKDYAQIIAEMMDSGRKFRATVAEVDTYKNNYYMQISIDEVD